MAHTGTNSDKVISSFLSLERIRQGAAVVGTVIATLRSLAHYLAESAFILLDIVAKSEMEILGILRRHDHTALHTCLGHIGSHIDEVQEKLTSGM